jgi:hypothetical protein
MPYLCALIRPKVRSWAALTAQRLFKLRSVRVKRRARPFPPLPLASHKLIFALAGPVKHQVGYKTLINIRYNQSGLER